MCSNSEIKVDCLKVINYAIQQNRIPFVRSIQLFNSSEAALENCVVHVSFSPDYAQDTDIQVGTIKAGSGLTIDDVPVLFSGEFLSSMTERVSGQLTASLLSDGDLVAEQVLPIEVLTYDEWPGISTYPEILASFVTPNHPAIAPIIKRASDILDTWKINGAIDGYLCNSPEKVKYLMAAIFEAIKEYQLAYCWLPASYSTGGQRIRLAHTILGGKLACCLDMACLYAGCLEASGLNPIVIIQNDHAFAGCHMINRLMQDPSTDDASLLMKLCADGINEMLVVETTSVLDGCIRPFDEAVALANNELAEIDKFNIAVDIKRSRLANILPLPLSIDGTVDPSLMTSEAYVSEQPSCLSDTDKIDPDAKDAVTKQKIWERRLLDLSMKNRMLNTRLSKEIIQLMATNLQELENAFATGKVFRLSHIPVEWVASSPKSAPFHHIASIDPVRDLIDTDMKQLRLHSFLNEEQMQSALKQLAYTSRTSLEECGANSLYLALGFLRLSDAETGTPIYAPIILFPVDLVRKSAASGYVVKSRDEDPVLNITLIEYLRQFYQIRIGGLDPLPRDGNGIDVSMVFNAFRKAVLHKKGWDVEEHAVLGVFSFSKQVMWNDIHTNASLFNTNPIVQSLRDGRLSSSIAGSENADIDAPSYEQKSIIFPLEADSSQESVIAGAINGDSFVIHGAPGTGKSQTITNIIANMLYRGKRVLFVAEKQAALDVVLKRLEAIGIAEFCLPLHSNKTSKSVVLEHFKKLLGLSKDTPSVPYIELVSRLSNVESELGNHVEAINRKRQAGYSLNDCISGYLSSDGSVVPGLPAGEWDESAVELRIGALEDFKNACGVVERPTEHAFADSRLTTLPSIDPRPAMERILTELKAAEEGFAAIWCAVFPPTEVKQKRSVLRAFANLCEVILNWHPANPSFLLNMSRTQMDSAKAALDCGIQYQETKKSILANYKESILDNSCWDLKNKLADVLSRDFISRLISEFKLRNAIKEYSLIGHRPGIEEIQELANKMAKLDSEGMRILESESLLKSIFGSKWDSSYENDWSAMKAELDLTIKVCDTLKAMSNSESEYYEMCDRLSGFVDSKLSDHSTEIEAFAGQMSGVMSSFDELCEILAVARDSGESESWFDETESIVEKWLVNYDSIREWVIYNSNRTRVIDLGLEKFVGLVEQGELQREHLVESFMKSFYCSYANHIIASDPSLALFHGLIFEDKADKFRHLHEQVQEITREELRNHLLQTLPSMQQEAANGNEAGLLQKSIRNGCRGLSLRNLFAQIPELLSKMCPCMLMSPISVAQYLTADGPQFDLVIFDEASQVPTCEAIGAIARGKSVVIVGDPNQMPPSDFFIADSFDEENAYMEDLESILDDCLALSMPSRRLLWHYRSKHESLIAFSNMHFYDNKLLTFPSIDDLSSRLHFELVEGTYDRGRSRQNAGEADAIINEIKQRLSNPDTAEKSIGVVTFNSSQQSLIEDRLNEMFKKNPALEKVAMKQAEPIFIKNLENVQGDERDVILFSIGYGLDKNGFMSLNFGPLNKEGGWRRLNVAVSRARYEMKVFSTVTSDQIDLNRSSSEGVAGLKAFLCYAEKGRDALRYNKVESVNTDDGIVLSIAGELRKKGFDVRTNIGCSGYRIDLGIVDPTNPEKYIAGVLCDGYNYAAAKTTKDREVVQIKILELLGWNICRVWALDYWGNRDKTISRLAERLNAIIEASSAKIDIEPQTEEVQGSSQSANESEETDESIDLEGVSAPENNAEAPKTSEEISDGSENSDPEPASVDVEETMGPKEEEVIPEGGDEPSYEETESIVKEMLKDGNEYEEKAFFGPVLTKISEDGFRSKKDEIDGLIMQLGELPSAAINAINEAYLDLLGTNLITEDGDEYAMSSDNYNKLKEEKL